MECRVTVGTLVISGVDGCWVVEKMFEDELVRWRVVAGLGVTLVDELLRLLPERGVD
jgi:hypothetical protein